MITKKTHLNMGFNGSQRFIPVGFQGNKQPSNSHSNGKDIDKKMKGSHSIGNDTDKVVEVATTSADVMEEGINSIPLEKSHSIPDEKTDGKVAFSENEEGALVDDYVGDGFVYCEEVDLPVLIPEEDMASWLERSVVVLFSANGNLVVIMSIIKSQELKCSGFACIGTSSRH
ncbi:hypothetical protein COLO4_29008 [Corchorus olitorius]|uniref:Uncharacterized protein n=1 Tax=Corchorus olitorius TaxID=93759 RepID=A0A1R3HGS0_9ROSI|nr:hypothetical protein COLO4_29008 [Corchorus olitorius]